MKKRIFIMERIGKGHPDINHWEWTHEIDWGNNYTLLCYAGFFNVTVLKR
jgi:hypothetical protein